MGSALSLFIIMSAFATAAGAATGPWRLQNLGAVGGTSGANLETVACPTNTHCLALGSGRSQGSVVALEWTGTDGWTGGLLTDSEVPVPGEPITWNEMSCASETFCVATGGSVTRDGANTLPVLASFDGTSWTITLAPMPQGFHDGELDSIDCSSPTACSAFGWYRKNNATIGADHTLQVQWDGALWRFVADAHGIPDRHFSISDGSCGDPSNCALVGIRLGVAGSPPVFATWDGHTWVSRRLPTSLRDPNARVWPTQVDCVGTSTCTALGTIFEHGRLRLFALRWQGGRLTTEQVTTPRDVQTASKFVLSEMDCVTRSGCTAVGYYGSKQVAPLIVSRDSGGWHFSRAPMPSKVGAAELYGVSCSGSTCVAVGREGRSFWGKTDGPLVLAG